MVRFHLRRFEAWAISFTPLCPCISEETLKTVGPNSCVSSRLAVWSIYYLRLEVSVVIKKNIVTQASVSTIDHLTRNSWLSLSVLSSVLKPISSASSANRVWESPDPESHTQQQEEKLHGKWQNQS